MKALKTLVREENEGPKKTSFKHCKMSVPEYIAILSKYIMIWHFCEIVYPEYFCEMYKFCNASFFY